MKEQIKNNGQQIISIKNESVSNFMNHIKAIIKQHKLKLNIMFQHFDADKNG